MRPIREGNYPNRVHASTDESGHLKTACGLDVKGTWQLVDQSWRPAPQPIDCPECAKEEP